MSFAVVDNQEIPATSPEPAWQSTGLCEEPQLTTSHGLRGIR